MRNSGISVHDRGHMLESVPQQPILGECFSLSAIWQFLGFGRVPCSIGPHGAFQPRPHGAQDRLLLQIPGILKASLRCTPLRAFMKICTTHSDHPLGVLVQTFRAASEEPSKGLLITFASASQASSYLFIRTFLRTFQAPSYNPQNSFLRTFL